LRAAKVLGFALLAIAVGGPARADGPEPARKRRWLVLDPVDATARRPFRFDAVFARYLLDPAAKAPAPNESVKGELGREVGWREERTDEDAPLEVPEAAWVFAEVKPPSPGTWIVAVRGVSTWFLDGTAHAGDVYGYGTPGVPVALGEGPHRLFATGIRGPIRVEFRAPAASIEVETTDAVLPDLVRGEEGPLDASVVVENATDRWADGVRIEGARVPRLPPLSATKVPFRLPRPKIPEGAKEVSFDEGGFGAAWAGRATFSLAVRDPSAARRRTFVSAIDGSVQFFAVLPPSGPKPDGARTGLVLTLHGAGVDALNQARAYSPKPDFWIVAPTNRRPFGFDWQDWGRLDAYEVLAEALRLSGVDRRDVHLTGHSMGGHGAWHLAANDPNGFASLAPSAGWISFDTYAGERRPGILEPLWRAADRRGDTLLLVPNLVRLPTYVLHGADDDNVPVDQARRIVEAIRAAGGSPTLEVVPGKGHWWDGDASPGADCVDWPPFFEMFRKHRIPEDPPPPAVDPAPPTAIGPFKRAFERNFVLVVGTAGDGAEDAALLDRARYDAEVWSYRGNGRAVVATDADVLGDPATFAGRNLVLYGNADTNGAWTAALPEGCPLSVRRDRVTAGSRTYEGDDLAALFVYPRRGEPASRVGVVAGTGLPGLRLTVATAVFSSGVGYPDFVVFSKDVLTRGDAGVRRAGFFDREGKIAEPDPGK
jgi:dienelactone hydrolase